MEHVLDLVERERVVALNLVGDASARPLLDALAAAAGPLGHVVAAAARVGRQHPLGRREGRAAGGAAVACSAIVEGIGSSESPAQAVAVTTRGGARRRVAARSRPKAETMVVDDDLRPIAPGSGVVGRLATRGRVPLGYYKDPERSARTFVEIDGERWSLPGDMATIDADGTIHLLGRGSLCINTGGEKVYPEEVEAVLKTASDGRRRGRRRRARRAARPAGRRGRRAGRPADARPTLDALQAHCRAHLAGYKVPRALHVVDAVRRTQAGKADYAWARAVVDG